MVLNPLIAYPLSLIDPAIDTLRDESESRLRLLRPALRMAARASPGLADVDGEKSFSSMIAETASRRTAVHISIFKSDSDGKPRIALVSPTAKAVLPTTADTFPEDLRVQCIPIDGDECVAVLNYPTQGMQAPKLTLDFSRRLAGSEVHVVFKRTKPTEMSASVFKSVGGRRTIALVGIESGVLDRLFAPVDVDVDTRLVPELPGDLPFDLVSAVADFFQTRIRCHVVAAACAPEGATRPLAFSKITLRRDGAKTAAGRAVLCATLHPSSVKCGCVLHGLDSMPARFPGERFVDSSVEFNLTMCGRPLGSSGNCTLHGNATPLVDAVPGVCCAGTAATLGCSHTNSKKRRRSGLFIPDLVLEGNNLLHAQTLLSASIRCSERLEPMLGKQPREDIERACDKPLAWLDRSLEELERRRAVSKQRSPSELLVLDMLAVDALRDSNVRRFVRPSTNLEVLVRERKGVAPLQLHGNESELSETHRGFFKPPLKTRRYGRG